MDVGGAFLDGVQQHLVDKANDRGLVDIDFRCGVIEVFDFGLEADTFKPFFVEVVELGAGGVHGALDGGGAGGQGAEGMADGATSTGDVSIGAQGVVTVLDLELTADRLTVTEVPIISENDVMSLPKGQAFALVEGARLWKLRMPLPDASHDPHMPEDLDALAEQMAASYRTADHWFDDSQTTSLLRVGTA